MEAEGPSAPPVVAVVVTCDAGPWLEEALAALRDQDYPALSVLVIDDASDTDVTARVAAILPTAFVRRENERRGYAPTANAVLGLVEGAAFFLLCHDDVAPEPDSLRIMVEEAFRSNAGIVGPKLVEWVEPDRILQVGMSIDKGGNPSSPVEPGELDQEQHDAVRDVFAVGGGCVLIRTDLFEALGGFNPALQLYGEDVDLCWRAQVAGARVVVAPGARVRHLEALTSGLRRTGAVSHDPLSVRDELRPLQLRHRLRAVLTNYSRFHLARVLPQLLLLSLIEIAFSLVTGRTATAAAVAGAWTWNVRHLGEIRASRKRLRGQRRVPDSEVRRLQVRGSARVTAFARGSAVSGRTRSLAEAGRDLATSFRDNRLLLAGWSALILLLVVGTRNLIGGRIPAVGQLQSFPSVGSFLSRFFSGWRDGGLGGASPAPAAYALLGGAGTLLLGA
ncbi:MAG: hypothetical protein QOG03_336, partial [Actinomycetota bacterium]|nr:hypothetical protein [Actinomycetota bacterium]